MGWIQVKAYSRIVVYSYLDMIRHDPDPPTRIATPVSEQLNDEGTGEVPRNGY